MAAVVDIGTSDFSGADGFVGFDAVLADSVLTEAVDGSADDDGVVGADGVLGAAFAATSGDGFEAVDSESSPAAFVLDVASALAEVVDFAGDVVDFSAATVGVADFEPLVLAGCDFADAALVEGVLVDFLAGAGAAFLVGAADLEVDGVLVDFVADAGDFEVAEDEALDDFLAGAVDSAAEEVFFAAAFLATLRPLEVLVVDAELDVAPFAGVAEDDGFAGVLLAAVLFFAVLFLPALVDAAPLDAVLFVAAVFVPAVLEVAGILVVVAVAFFAAGAAVLSAVFFATRLVVVLGLAALFFEATRVGAAVFEAAALDADAGLVVETAFFVGAAFFAAAFLAATF
ncbi:hypothetical protein IEE94_14930 [Yimella sp. cx-573]|nr:hypothetical protein [Yimella sp. cx-573]